MNNKLFTYLKGFARRNVDSDLLATSLFQLWRLLSAPLVLIFIPLFLDQTNQGFWFTFTSLSALAVFADLGFTNIVLQFSAHEFAHLKFNDEYLVVGNQNHVSRISSLFVFIIKWTSMMICLVFPVILLVGIFLFKDKSENGNWMIPWIIYLIGSAINFFNNTILSFIEGCNLVSKVQMIRFETAIINTLTILVLLYLKGSLYALSIGMLLSSIFIFIQLFRKFRKLVRQLIINSKKYKHSWQSEILSLLWRYALSFVSGYFIFQIYTPLAFHYYSPVEAGKVGISMTLWSALSTISLVWITSKIPKINMHTARREWEKLDWLVFKNTVFSVFTFISGIAALGILMLLIKPRFDFANRILSRFLDVIPLFSLGIAWLLQVIINAMAFYLRSHKKEPLVVPSVVSSLYIAVTTYIIITNFPMKYLFMGFLSSYVFGLPWIIYIFNSKKKEWHAV